MMIHQQFNLLTSNLKTDNHIRDTPKRTLPERDTNKRSLSLSDNSNERDQRRHKGDDTEALLNLFQPDYMIKKMIIVTPLMIQMYSLIHVVTSLLKNVENIISFVRVKNNIISANVAGKK